MFKKRILKGNLRAKTENPNGSEAGEESLLAKAVEIRDEQVERKRLLGINLSVTEKSHSGDPAEDDKRSISSMMTGQYRMGKEDLGASLNSSHSAIMEKYVADKLGLSRDDSATIKRFTADDELYVVPDNIKLGGFSGPMIDDKHKKGDDFLAGDASGLAEIKLPDKFKVKNIQDTEMACLRKEEHMMQEQMDKLHRGSLSRPNYRYSQPTDSHIPPSIKAKPVEVSIRPLEPEKPPRSNDDVALSRFIKRQKIQDGRNKR